MGIITAILVTAVIVSVTVSVIQAFQPPKPSRISFGGVGGNDGPRYGTFGPLDNTVSNELAVPFLYGELKLAGNVIWQTDPGETVSRIVGLCEGEIASISDVRANDNVINDSNTPGSSYSEYLGTASQKADSRVPDPLRRDLEMHNFAYVAITLMAGDTIKGGNPAITSVVQGLLVKTWTGAGWTAGKSFSRNPAACVRDLLTNSRYGLGLNESSIDDASFGQVYDYCEELLRNEEPYTSDAQTAMLLRLEGSQGSTTFTDSSGSPKTVTAGGNAIIDTRKFYMGVSSAYLDGASYLSIVNNSDFDFASGDLTMEFAVFPKYILGDQTIWGQYEGGSGNRNVSLKIQSDGTVRFYMESGSALVELISTKKVNAGVWSHIAVVRSGSNWILFINGNVADTATYAGAYAYVSGQSVSIGSTNSGSGYVNYFYGNIDEVRISKGVARWTGGFQIPQQSEKRYQLDYIGDSQRPAADVLNDILATFAGFLVYSGNRIKLKCEKVETVTQYFGDGSTTKANATFDPNNIVRDSMSWNVASMDDRPNRIKVQWIDPSQNYVKVYSQIDDRIDQDERSIVNVKEISLLGITRASQASRMAKMYMSKTKYAATAVELSARLESIHCEIGDVVAVTHQAARYSRKLFRITDMQEAEDETIRLTLTDYNASIYDDHQGAAVLVMQQPSGPNFYAPLEDVTGLTVLEDNFKQKDGVFATNILVSWTALSDDLLSRLDHYLIQISQDGGLNYRDAAFASPSKTSYRIPIGNVQTGTTFTIRVKTVSDRGAESVGATGEVTIIGKRTPPSDVEDFDVNFATDRISMTWSAVDDEDLYGYELRMGNAQSTWETATIITTETAGTKFDFFDFTRGIKKFYVKAIDNSGNYSENAASDSINISNIPDSNVVFTFDLWSRVTVFPHPLEGTLSSELDRVPENDYDSRYNRVCYMPKTVDTWLDLQNAGGTWEDLQDSSFRWNEESFVTSEETYETTPIDLGGVLTGSYVLEMYGNSSSNLGFISPYISVSDDGITYSSFVPFVAGQYRARYVKFRFLIQATDSDTRVRLSGALLTVDVPDKKAEYLGQAISASGTTINLDSFIAVKSVVITTVGSDNYNPVIVDQSGLPNNFTIKLFDSSDVAQAGTVNIYVSGY